MAEKIVTKNCTFYSLGDLHCTLHLDSPGTSPVTAVYLDTLTQGWLGGTLFLDNPRTSLFTKVYWDTLTHGKYTVPG